MFYIFLYPKFYCYMGRTSIILLTILRKYLQINPAPVFDCKSEGINYFCITPIQKASVEKIAFCENNLQNF